MALAAKCRAGLLCRKSDDFRKSHAETVVRINRFAGLAEQLDMHGLIVSRPWIHFVERFTVLPAENFVGFLDFQRLPVADFRVHRMVRTAAVHADPTDFLAAYPLNEIQRRAGMAKLFIYRVERRLVWCHMCSEVNRLTGECSKGLCEGDRPGHGRRIPEYAVQRKPGFALSRILSG